MIHAVVFDKDGTLLDFEATWMPAIRALARHMAGGHESLTAQLLNVGGYVAATGTIKPDSHFASGNAMTLADAWLPLLEDRNHRLQSLARTIDDVYRRESAAHITALFDVGTLFKKLREHGILIGIASSDAQAGVVHMLEQLELTDLTDFHCGHDSGHGYKPGPGMVEAFCISTNMAPEHVAVVGDNSHDLEMGRRAGVGLTVGVLSGTSKEPALAPLADHILPSAEHLPQVIGIS